MSENNMIAVEVAYALPDRQQIIALEVAEGTTALETARQSGITKSFPEIDIDGSKMGIFGKAVKPAKHVMKAGERVEIYRPLLIDPKENRKERAARAKAAKS
jgi:putative ubiquitin-RnfH superfamily antitoxin RatB of RatAB toxin-antitoxin module